MHSSHLRTTVAGRIGWNALVLMAVTWGAGHGMWPRVVLGQGAGSYPSAEYFLAQAALDEGEFRTAGKAFSAAARSGFRTVDGRWVDSICYYTMLGESLYQMGDLAGAMEQYNAALQLFLAQRNWLLGVQFPPTSKVPTYNGPPITWGVKTRATAMGPFPEKAFATNRGLATLQLTDNGSVVGQQQYVTLYIGEVARCIAISLRRRAEILGPLAKHDPMTSQLTAALTARPAPPNHWTQAWVDCWLGLTYIAAGRPMEAATSLQNSLTAAGNFDHVLTAIGLLELGKLSVAAGQYEQAANYFHEATFPAVMYGQNDILEEALRWSAWNHMASGKPGVYPSLPLAAAWAERKGLRFLQVSLLVESAEQLARTDPKSAAATLETARRGMLRRDMAAGRVGARYQFLLASTNYHLGNIAAGDAALALAMKFYQASSPMAYQMVLADRLAGSLTEHAADELYSIVLREPTALDWTLFPADTLAVSLNAGTAPWEHWFELSLKRNDLEKGVEIIDRIRRRQFLSSIPMGGRLLALRWLLEGPPEVLSDAAKLQRQDLFVKYPALQELGRKAGELKAALHAGDLVPAAASDAEKQARDFTDLATVSTQQELILRQVAVGRNPCEYSFPPLSSLKDLRQRIGTKEAVWMFFASSRDVYSFVIRKEGAIVAWRLAGASKIRSTLADMLRQMGNLDGNYVLMQRDISDTWQNASRALFLLLTNQTEETAELPWKDAEELVIIPHGILWYLPFEALLAGPTGTTEPLITTTRVRYAPLLSLAVPDRRKVSPIAQTLLVADKLHPQEGDSIPDAEAAELASVVPGIQRVKSSKIPSPFLASISDRAVVLADLDPSRGGPLGWAPLPIDAAKGDNSIMAWMDLPWGAPQQLVLPGFHTLAETGLKKGGSGDEIFLTVCGLLATGSRSVLISRWRVGGASSRKLIREYLQELPHLAPSNAWQRSVQLLRLEDLDLDAEPRVNRSTFTEPLSGRFPFFWAGYMLVDRGTEETAPSGPAAAAP